MDVGLACCALEFGSAVAQGLLVPVEGDGRAATVLVVSGTVTDALAPAVVNAWRELGEPEGVLSFGSCASTGGPYWDAPTVAKGIDQLLKVQVYVPGCPPRPEALIAALRRIAEDS